MGTRIQQPLADFAHRHPISFPGLWERPGPSCCNRPGWEIQLQICSVALARPGWLRILQWSYGDELDYLIWVQQKHKHTSHACKDGCAQWCHSLPVIMWQTQQCYRSCWFESQASLYQTVATYLGSNDTLVLFKGCCGGWRRRFCWWNKLSKHDLTI